MSRRRAARLNTPEYVDEIHPEHLRSGKLGVVVFGPGYGEAIVVCLPDGFYGVVDGCRRPHAGDLDGIGDPVREFLLRAAARAPLRIRFVCLTHPHLDHYKGLTELLQAHHEVIDEVWCPPETGTRYAQAYARWYGWSTRADGLPDERRTELDRLFAELQSARRASQYLGSRTQLLRQSMKAAPLEIWALAPTARDRLQAQQRLVRAIRAMSDDDISAASYDPNRASGALLISWSRAKILLAGDLLTGDGDQQRGWNRACEMIDSRVQVVNVAHHASEKAHHAELWQTMSPALALVTPFQHATNKHPPKPEDIRRLLDSGAHVAVTSPPSWEGRADTPIPTREREAPTIRSKNPALAITPDNREADKRNAVAVSLGKNGHILRMVLAGKARLYQ